MQRITTLYAVDEERQAELSVRWQSEHPVVAEEEDRIVLVRQKHGKTIAFHLTAAEAELLGEALQRAAQIDRQATAEFWLEDLERQAQNGQTISGD